MVLIKLRYFALGIVVIAFCMALAYKNYKRIARPEGARPSYYHWHTTLQNLFQFLEVLSCVIVFL